MVNCISQEYKDMLLSMLDQHIEEAVISAFLSVVPSCEKVRAFPQATPAPVVPGTCYDDAWRFLIKEEEGTLVHGTIFSGGRRMGHAWIETSTGWIWEPQTGKYFTLLGFRNALAPNEESRYTVEEAAIMVARTKHLGPWTERERQDSLSHREKVRAVPQVTPKGVQQPPPLHQALITDSIENMKAKFEAAKTPQGVAKEPWQMTRAEFLAGKTGLELRNQLIMPISNPRSHYAQIVKAINEGKPVPPEVLEEWLDLPAKAVTTPAPEVTETVWNTLPAYRQAEIAKSVGLTPRAGTVYWKELTPSEREILSKAKIEPKAEAVTSTPAVAPATEEIAKFQDKLAKTTARNSSNAEKELDKLEDQGVDVGEARELLDNYQYTERSDFDSAEEFGEARTEAWEEFVEAVNALEPLGG